MEKYVATPRLELFDALPLACSRLFDFGGRSRRSEFWWFIFVFCFFYFLVSFILTLFLPLLPSTIIISLLWVFAMGVTIRRLQDNGHSKWWVIASLVVTVVYNVYLNNYTDVMFELTSVNSSPDSFLKSIAEDSLLIVLSLLNTFLSIVIFVMCLMDGKPEPNKYGESPKYELASAS